MVFISTGSITAKTHAKNELIIYFNDGSDSYTETSVVKNIIPVLSLGLQKLRFFSYGINICLE